MRKQLSISVRNKQESEAIRIALEDRATRALVIVTGILLQLPTDRARARVVRLVKDKIESEEDRT